MMFSCNCFGSNCFFVAKNYDYYHYNHIGDFYCKNCGHKRMNPKFAVTTLNLDNNEMVINDKYKISMNYIVAENSSSVVADSVLVLTSSDPTSVRITKINGTTL